MMKLKQRLMSGGVVMMAFALIGTSQVSASKINDAGLELLGITEAEYETARDEAAGPLPVHGRMLRTRAG